MTATNQHVTRDPRRRWPTRATALLRDAWVFFTLLVLLVTVFVFLWPLQIIDRVTGTRMVARLIGVIERVGDI
ncbi:MAG: hypothetical protein HYY84_02365 [Deltaproteobacteria bacterium]|nr:hypothetical protein [Deltaproteobacteria bacterium]